MDNDTNHEKTSRDALNEARERNDTVGDQWVKNRPKKTPDAKKDSLGHAHAIADDPRNNVEDASQKNSNLHVVSDSLSDARKKADEERIEAYQRGVITPLINEVVPCPACKGQPLLETESACPVCRGDGQVRRQQITKDGPVSFVTLNGTTIVDAPTRPFNVNDGIVAVQQHLSDLIQELGRVRAGLKSYHVPVVFKSALDGLDETTTRLAFGRNPQEASFNATHDAQRNQWAKVSGDVKLVGIGPSITEAWIAKALALKIE